MIQVCGIQSMVFKLIFVSILSLISSKLDLYLVLFTYIVCLICLSGMPDKNKTSWRKSGEKYVKIAQEETSIEKTSSVAPQIFIQDMT